MNKLYVYLYNKFYQWRMRNARAKLETLVDVEVSSYNTLEKILPVLKEQLELINPKYLRMVGSGDVAGLELPVYFLQYFFFTQWLRASLKTVSTKGNLDGKGYINLTNEVSGYSVTPLKVRVSLWLPYSVMNENGSVSIDLFYGMVRDDIANIELVMKSVTDPFFKSYYDQRFAASLQDVVYVAYAINHMVAFYEWKR